ncbi:MAG: Fur family transcriptional regulator [Bryobacteraceae bacterium]
MRSHLGLKMEEFRQRCREAGLALTHQREAIYRAVVESEDHPSPEAIYAKVRKRIPTISLATVYKNIRTFLEAGLLREVTLHHGTLRLEPEEREHHHLVCVRCKAILDLEPDAVTPVRLRRSPPAGYRILRCHVEFHGLCPACAAKTARN